MWKNFSLQLEFRKLDHRFHRRSLKRKKTQKNHEKQVQKKKGFQPSKSSMFFRLATLLATSAIRVEYVPSKLMVWYSSFIIPIVSVQQHKQTNKQKQGPETNWLLNRC
jgi:hypothetical protein